VLARSGCSREGLKQPLPLPAAVRRKRGLHGSGLAGRPRSSRNCTSRARTDPPVSTQLGNGNMLPAPLFHRDGHPGRSPSFHRRPGRRRRRRGCGCRARSSNLRPVDTGVCPFSPRTAARVAPRYPARRMGNVDHWPSLGEHRPHRRTTQPSSMRNRHALPAMWLPRPLSNVCAPENVAADTGRPSD